MIRKTFDYNDELELEIVKITKTKSNSEKLQEILHKINLIIEQQQIKKAI